MDLTHNGTFRVLAGEYEGLYRVVVVHGEEKFLLCARLDPPEHSPVSKPGRRAKPPETRKRKPKKPPRRLITKLQPFVFGDIDRFEDAHRLLKVELRRPGASFPIPSTISKDLPALVGAEPEAAQPNTGSPRKNDGPEDNDSGGTGEDEDPRFKLRMKVMAPFLDPATLANMVWIDWGAMVREAVQQHNVSGSFVYKLVSQLCLYGFVETSLRTEYDKCGAPGTPRPVDPGGRRKAGRLTSSQRKARSTNAPPPTDVQPGVSTDWRIRILAADSQIPAPKPRMSARVDLIRKSHFATCFELTPAGSIKSCLGPPGTYPNNAQIARVLRTSSNLIRRAKDSTTPGHFQRNMRGLVGRSWKGVAGPGHTWAIDSTVGDVYLRSSVNRAWILGRPIVYVIVDVWSTAVVGFYVCLSAPSWPMARVALFNACIEPALFGDLWGFFPVCVLEPRPTLCAILMCDRGEYLSKGAAIDGLKLRLSLSYAPPYRPDYKGIVEVLHRIEKDAQYGFIPGAIDMRRAEYELRHIEPWRGALTIPEFVQYLYALFTDYNLNADRSSRFDGHMTAGDYMRSPAGLWKYGYDAGIGFTRYIGQDELIHRLLPAAPGYVTREGLKFGGLLYECNADSMRDWTALARNDHGWDVIVRPYPGSLSRIWTSQHSGEGFVQLPLCEQGRAERELTIEEALDLFAIQRLMNPQITSSAAEARVRLLNRVEDIVEKAICETAAADATFVGPRPSQAEARAMEAAAATAQVPTPLVAPEVRPLSEDELAYVQAMQGILKD